MNCEKCKKEIDGTFGSGRFCCRSCANSKRMEDTTKKKISQKLKGRRIGSSVYTFRGYEDRPCEICKNKFNIKKSKPRRTCSQECHFKLLSKTTKGVCGGYRKNSVRGKSINYKTKNGGIVHLQSTYEERVAIELDKNNIQWQRPSPLDYINRKGENKRYFADFYLIDYEVYLDPKNSFLILTDTEKIEMCAKQNNVKIFILNKFELEWDKIKNKISLVSPMLKTADCLSVNPSLILGQSVG